jgi:hypothetical protein
MGSAQLVALLKENYGSIECPTDVTGFFPNPYDCSAYHFCSAGKDQVILCEPGLHYRQDKQVCDWPINANCNYDDFFQTIDKILTVCQSLDRVFRHLLD